MECIESGDMYDQWHTDEAFNYIANADEHTYLCALDNVDDIEVWVRENNITQDSGVDLDLVDWKEVTDALIAE